MAYFDYPIKYIFAIFVLTLLMTLFYFVLVYKRDYQKIDLNVIAKIESNNNPLAENKKSGARGTFQVVEICLKDYNDFHKDNPIFYSDLFDKQKNRIIAEWYIAKRLPQILKCSGVKATTRNILYSYNWGPGKVIEWVKNGSKINELPSETREYYNKYNVFKQD